LKKSVNNLDYFKIITNASDLTLDKFIICICDENYHVLAKKNGVKEIELKKAWSKIYDEYFNIIKDKEQSYIMTLYREINLIEFKINVINGCVSYLNIFKDEEIVNILRQFIPVYGKFDENNEEQYNRDLQTVINFARKFIIELETKSIELNKLTPKEKQSITRDYFDQLIWELSKYVKYQINKYTISASEFARGIANMRSYYEHLIQHQNAK
jgi:hypothetical protein